MFIAGKSWVGLPGRPCNEELPLEALEQAIMNAKDIAGLVHHSDHGSQYASIKYSEKLADYGIKSSTGTVGDSYDNALARVSNRLCKLVELKGC
ncbi:DDE-type integrase/transposase/recombinase [Mobiluncus mulieris]|nr:DDE-type integrase/transposase/recombinase [Mobiluncus mulieris]